MVVAADLNEIEGVNANCILMANLQPTSTSGTQTDKAPVYDSDGSAELHDYDNCYNNEIFNMFTQEDRVEHDGGTVEQHPAIVEETHTYFESLYNNLAIEVEKVNTVNRKLRETNADLTIELARYKNQEKCFEISQEKYDKLESSGKQITNLNEEISNLNNQLSKEKSNVSSLQEEKKRLKSDFKIREDGFLDKQIQLENKIKELDNILVKTGQLIQTMHMLSPKPDSFYHTEQKMALGYQNPFNLKQAQQKQQSLYNGKVLLEKHDPPVVHDSKETLQLAQEKAAKFVQDFKYLAKEADESLAKHKALELEIERLLRAAVSQDIMSIVQNPTVVETSDLQTKLEQCKYDKISYDKAYNDMQQKIKRLQAQLGDLKGKSTDTPCVSDTLDPLFQKLENENMELEFQIKNYAKENAHLKSAYKNLFYSINVSRAQTKGITDSLQNKLNDMIYENMKLRAQLSDKVSEQKDTTNGTSVNTQFCKQSILGKPPSSSGPKLYSVTPFPKSKGLPKIDESHALSKPVTSNSVPTPQESKVVKNDKVIAPGMFRINHFKTSREEKHVPNKPTKASVKTKPITVSQPHVITKKYVNSDSNSLSSTGIDNTAKTNSP
ncbi:hypothetical protein Tco_0349609 [Tanacetum coccineum]